MVFVCLSKNYASAGSGNPIFVSSIFLTLFYSVPGIDLYWLLFIFFPENTHHFGKDHCKDGLQFYWFGFLCNKAIES